MLIVTDYYFQTIQIESIEIKEPEAAKLTSNGGSDEDVQSLPVVDKDFVLKITFKDDVKNHQEDTNVALR